MIKKDFKISYQTIKECITFIFFFIVLWIAIARYYDFIINIQLKSIMGANQSAIEIVLYILLIYVLIWTIYVICKGFVSLFYMIAKDSHWYDGLMQYKINIPITIKQYEKIKNNKMFFIKDKFKDSKPYFSYTKVDVWAIKIIDKEMGRLK